MKNKNLKVLAYHKVLNKESFEQQLNYLKKCYNLISLTELKMYFFKDQDLPNNALLLTFDDGDKSLYTNAFPFFKKYNIPAIIFIITELIDTHKPFWWDEIEYYLGKKNGTKKLLEIKNWNNIDRENYLQELRLSSKKPLLSYEQLTSSQLIEMQNEGIEIANHSHTHPIFDRCTTQRLEYEIQESKSILNSLKSNAAIFAYPNGNYSDVSEEILNKNKINLAFLFDHKINLGKINPLRISRLKINDNAPLWKLKLILSGWHFRILPFTMAIGKLYRKFT